MRKILTVVLALAVLLAPLSALAQEPVPVLRFGMTAVEAEAAMGSHGSVKTLTSSDGTVLDCLVYNSRRISQYDDFSLNLSFRDGRLIMKVYGFDSDDGAVRYTYLSKALAQKYGRSGEDMDSLACFLNLIGHAGMVDTSDPQSVEKAGGHLSTWRLEDGSSIVLLYLPSRSSGIIFLSYIAAEEMLSGEWYDDTGL